MACPFRPVGERLIKPDPGLDGQPHGLRLRTVAVVAAILRGRVLPVNLGGLPEELGFPEALAAELRDTGVSAQPYVAELAALDQVRDLAERVGADHPALHVLINNAGIGAGPPPHTSRELSADGHELRLAVNYLAPVLLSRLLVPRLAAGAPARIVNVGSVGQSEVDLADLRFDRGYHGGEAYFRSKFALPAFTVDLAEELRPTGVTVTCVHPATFMDTLMVREAGLTPRSTVNAGAEAVLNLAVGSAGADRTGQYFEGTCPKKAHRRVYRDAVRRDLRMATNDLLRPYRPTG